MVFKLCQSASKKWRRLDGSHQIADIIQGVKFKDGEKLTERAARYRGRHRLAVSCQRRSKSTPLAGVKMHHLMRFSPALAVVPVVHRRDPRCFV